MKRILTSAVLLVCLIVGTAKTAPIGIPSALSPWVDTSSHASFASAHSAAASTGKGIIVSTNMTISTATTVTVPIQVVKGGMLTKSGSGTIAINGAFEAGMYQVFSGFSAGNVTGLKEARFEWFGAIGNGTTDDTTAINVALSSVATGGNVTPGGDIVYNGSYLISSTVTVPSGVHLIGQGRVGLTTGYLPSSYFLKKSTMNTTGIILSDGCRMSGGGIKIQSGATGDGIAIQGKDIKLSHVSAIGDGSGSASGNGFRIGTDAGVVANSWYMEACFSGYWSVNGFYIHDNTGGSPNVNAGTMVDCHAQENGGDGFKFNNSYLNTVVGGLAEANLGYGLWSASQYLTIIGGDREANSLGQIYIHADAAQNKILAGNTAEVSDNSSTTVRGDRYIANQGTWTPSVITSNADGVYEHTEQIGHWFREGDYVTVSGRVLVSAITTTGTGYVKISGLPLTSVNFATGIFYAGSISQSDFVTLDTGYTQLGVRVDENTTSVTVTESGSNVSALALPPANLNAGSRFVFSVKYPVNSF